MTYRIDTKNWKGNYSFHYIKVATDEQLDLYLERKDPEIMEIIGVEGPL